MTSNSRPWSDADCSELEQRLNEGQDFDEIADALGRTPLSVTNKAYNMGFCGGRGVEGAKGYLAAQALVPASAPHASFIAKWMGDPPPGRSALDQRRQ